MTARGAADSVDALLPAESPRPSRTPNPAEMARRAPRPLLSTGPVTMVSGGPVSVAASSSNSEVRSVEASDNLEVLVGMGFEAASAASALARAGGHLNQAIELLTVEQHGTSAATGRVVSL